jgi:hypothetical protein
MKQRFIEFTKVAFWDVQKADYEFPGSFAYVKHNFRDFVQVAFLHNQDAENDFARPFDTLKHRSIDYHKVVLRHPESRSFSYLKYHFHKFVKVAFLKSQDAENKFTWHLVTSNISSLTTPRSLFKMSTRQITISVGHSPTRNITTIISTKSLY